MNSKTRCLILNLLLLAAGIFAESEFSLGNNRIFLQDFKASGVLNLKDKEAVPQSEQPSTWMISGEQAVMHGEQYQLSGFEMHITNPERGTISLLSPHCDFNRFEYQIKSNSPLLLHADGLQISGLGYDVYQEDGKMMLVVRSTVQIHFRKERIKKLRGSKS